MATRYFKAARAHMPRGSFRFLCCKLEAGVWWGALAAEEATADALALAKLAEVKAEAVFEIQEPEYRALLVAYEQLPREQTPRIVLPGGPSPSSQLRISEPVVSVDPSDVAALPTPAPAGALTPEVTPIEPIRSPARRLRR